MNYAEIKHCDIANGPGVRVSLFVSGCRHHCKGCFNECAWDFNYGKQFTTDTIDYIMKCMEPDYISGITFLGGEPMDPNNICMVGFTIERIRTNPELQNKSIWLFSGYTFEQLKENAEKSRFPLLYKYIFENIDVLVDGPFIEEKKNLMLRFRGSENQRIIDMKKTLESGEVVLWDKQELIATPYI